MTDRDLDVAAAAHSDRLVLFAPGHPRYDGRRARRARMLALTPVDQTESVPRDPLTPRPTGVHWEYLLADDSALFVRARDLADLEEARWDAARLFGSGTDLRPVYVRDRDSGQLSWWLVREHEPVLLAPRLWLPSQRATVVRSARRAVAALRVRPLWGAYEG